MLVSMPRQDVDCRGSCWIKLSSLLLKKKLILIDVYSYLAFARTIASQNDYNYLLT